MYPKLPVDEAYIEALTDIYKTHCWLSPPGYKDTHTTTNWLPVPLQTRHLKIPSVWHDGHILYTNGPKGVKNSNFKPACLVLLHLRMLFFVQSDVWISQTQAFSAKSSVSLLLFLCTFEKPGPDNVNTLHKVTNAERWQVKKSARGCRTSFVSHCVESGNLQIQQKFETSCFAALFP